MIFRQTKINLNLQKAFMLTSALVFSGTGIVNAATVTISNPSFESSFDGWTDTDPSAISSDANTGSKSAKITGSAGSVLQTVAVTANTDYQLSAYIKGTGKIGAIVNGTTYANTGSSSSYTEVSVAFNSGSATSISIFDNYNGGEGRFDDFSLQSSSSVPPASSTAFSVPGVIQAEDYTDFADTTAGNTGGKYRTDDVDVQVTTDTGGGFNVGWIKSGEWLEYPINVTQTGTYTADIRIASSKATGAFNVLVDGSSKGSVAVGSTGGWQVWTTKTVELGTLSAGEHTVRIDVTGSDFNINWIDIQKEAGTTQPPVTGNFDWDGWKVTLPVNGDTWYNDGNTATAAEIQPSGCSNDVFDESLSTDYFWSDSEGLHFKVPMNLDGKTPNTSYIRSELRELYNWTPCSTTSEANWSYGGDHTLSATIRIDDYDPSNPKVVVGQIHGHDISYATIKLHWEGDSKPIRVIYNQTPSSSTPNNVYLGYVDSSTFWDYSIKMTDTGIELSAGGVTKTITFGNELSNDWKNADFYFKAGLYPQQKPSSTSTETYEATFSKVLVSH